MKCRPLPLFAAALALTFAALSSAFAQAPSAAAVTPPPAKNSNRADWMREARFGVMTHYLHDWIASDGWQLLSAEKRQELTDAGLTQREWRQQQMTPENWNKLVDAFDVETCADQLKSVGADYYLISIGQNSGYYISPNATYDRIVGISPSKLSRRDLVADLAAALSKRGIRLLVYLPSGAPAGDRVAREALQWQNGPFRNAEFQRHWEAIIMEWSKRWGDKIAGWWYDGCYWPNQMYRTEEAPNFKSFAAASRAGNPNAVVAFNPGVVNRTISVTPHEDYIAGEVSNPTLWNANRHGSGYVDGAQLHFLGYLGTRWGQGAPRFSTEEAVAFTTAVAAVGSAVTWDTPTEKNGTFRPEFLAQLKAIGEAIDATPLRANAPGRMPVTPGPRAP